MVNWERVQELRSKGWDWAGIAKDPKVDFHAEASAGSPGRQLRALYHRSGRRAVPATSGATPKVSRKDGVERRWTLTRVGYLVVPVAGVWFAIALLAPSPVGLVVPAIPWLALALAVLAFVLIWALWRRTEGPRWSTTYRNTVIGGVVLGLVVAGSIGLAGSLIFGCPYLPSTTSPVANSSWAHVSAKAWQSGGEPVVYFYGASWCPYCSASSWAIWKALSAFGTVQGTVPGDYASSTDAAGPSTPEIVLAYANVAAKGVHGPSVSFQVSEDTSGVEGNVPATSSCFQQAYLSAYSGGGIPFVVVNGQYVHEGSLVSPSNLASWRAGTNGGDSSVQASVSGETSVSGGNPWTSGGPPDSVQSAAWWMMALIAYSLGWTIGDLTTYGGSSYYGWSAADISNVGTDMALI